jgi:hypothetical protein
MLKITSNIKKFEFVRRKYMKKRVALVLSILLAASILVTREPANAFKLWPWHKAKVEKVAPVVEAPKAEPQQVTPVSEVKKAPEVKKDVPVVNKVEKPAPAVQPCAKKTCPVKKPCQGHKKPVKK